jgi:hypothetical protein
MAPFYEYIDEYRAQMEKGYIRQAYRGMMGYIMDLKTYFKNKYPAYAVSGSIYQGYMDMTYFALFPEPLKSRKLKIAIVFLHETVRFEVWLAAYNRQVQAEYWKLFKESDWNKYRIPSSIKGMDSIVEYTLADNPDFSDPDALTAQIESRTLNFTGDIEGFLAGH